MIPTKLGEVNYDGYIVEVHYNTNLKIKPYLIRIYSCHNFPYECRIDKLEIDQLLDLIEKVIKDNESY